MILIFLFKAFFNGFPYFLLRLHLHKVDVMQQQLTKFTMKLYRSKTWITRSCTVLSGLLEPLMPVLLHLTENKLPENWLHWLSSTRKRKVPGEEICIPSLKPVLDVLAKDIVWCVHVVLRGNVASWIERQPIAHLEASLTDMDLHDANGVFDHDTIRVFWVGLCLNLYDVHGKMNMVMTIWTRTESRAHCVVSNTSTITIAAECSRT